MNFNNEMKLRSHNVMQMRARGLPLVRVAQYKKEIDAAQALNETLLAQITLVAGQRDAFARRIEELLRELRKENT